MRFLAMTISLVFLVQCTQSSKAQQKIYGQIEAEEIDIASRVPSRIKRVAVKIGQKVKAGDLLVEFEDDIISAKRRQAEAVLEGAKSKSSIAEQAVRPEEKAQLRAGALAAKKQMDFAKNSLSRAQMAFREGAISQQALEEVNFKYEAAKEAYHAAMAKEQMGKVGARAEEKAGAKALLSQAENVLAEAQAYNKDINLVSPVDGEVAQILNHEGELVPAGYPVVTILKTDELWVTFQLSEDKLKQFTMGKEVSVSIPALAPMNIKAPISFISPMAGFANKVSTQDRGTIDLKTFEIRATIPKQEGALRPGMTAFVQNNG